jgi:hypothetical protein
MEAKNHRRGGCILLRSRAGTFSGWIFSNENFNLGVNTKLKIFTAASNIQHPKERNFLSLEF